MAIQMTRAEYQAKYGTPSVSQPIKMTRSEYESKYGNPSAVEKPSFVEKVANLAPASGGIIGGVTGGILGGSAGSIVPGAGTVAGGIAGSGAGTALGTMGGNVIKNSVLDLFGKQKKSSIDQLKQSGKESAVAGATDVITGGILHGAGKIAKPIFKSIGKVVEDIPLKSIRVNPSQITKWSGKHGEDLSAWMVKNKILGENALDLAEGSADSLQNRFNDLAMNENITIPVSKLKERVSKEIMDLAGATGGVKNKFSTIQDKNVAQKILNEWGNIEKQAQQMGVSDVTPAMLTQLRRRIDEAIPKGTFAKPVSKNVDLRLRRIINDVVQEGVDARLIGNGQKGSLKELGKELSKYYDFLDIAGKQENLGRGSLLGNLPRILSGGSAGTIGAMIGGVPGAVIGTTAGLAGESALRSPEVLKSIYQGGKKAAKIFPKVSKVGKAIFQRIPSAISTLNQ